MEKDIRKATEKLAKSNKKFIKEFKEFISRGNVVDLAVGVVIGGAFSKIVSSLVNDIIMPLVGIIMAVLTLPVYLLNLTMPLLTMETLFKL